MKIGSNQKSAVAQEERRRCGKMLRDETRRDRKIRIALGSEQNIDKRNQLKIFDEGAGRRCGRRRRGRPGIRRLHTARTLRRARLFAPGGRGRRVRSEDIAAQHEQTGRENDQPLSCQHYFCLRPIHLLAGRWTRVTYFFFSPASIFFTYLAGALLKSSRQPLQHNFTSRPW